MVYFRNTSVLAWWEEFPVLTSPYADEPVHLALLEFCRNGVVASFPPTGIRTGDLDVHVFISLALSPHID